MTRRFKGRIQNTTDQYRSVVDFPKSFRQCVSCRCVPRSLHPASPWARGSIRVAMESCTVVPVSSVAVTVGAWGTGVQPLPLCYVGEVPFPHPLFFFRLGFGLFFWGGAVSVLLVPCLLPDLTWCRMAAPAGEAKVIVLRTVGGEIGAAASLAPKVGPLGLVRGSWGWGNRAQGGNGPPMCGCGGLPPACCPLPAWSLSPRLAPRFFVPVFFLLPLFIFPLVPRWVVAA